MTSGRTSRGVPLTRVRADLLAIAAQNVERRLNPMPSFLALVRQIRRSSLENRVHAPAWEFSRRGKPWTSVYTTTLLKIYLADQIFAGLNQPTGWARQIEECCSGDQRRHPRHA